MIYKKKKLTIKLLSHAFYEMSKKRLERLEEAEGGSKKTSIVSSSPRACHTYILPYNSGYYLEEGINL